MDERRAEGDDREGGQKMMTVLFFVDLPMQLVLPFVPAQMDAVHITTEKTK